MSKNVAMFVDVANMYYAARGQDVDVDYVALLKHATKGRDLIRAYAYTGLDPENENQRRFIDFLAKNGYKPVVKDIRKFGDGRMKANLDIELVVDLFRLADRMDIAVIVSGDGDFAPAIRALQDKGVRAEVISFRPNTSSDLIAVADEFMDMMKIASISRKEGRAVRDAGSAPEMPAKEVSPEFGFRDASPSVAAAAIAAIKGGGTDGARRGRAGSPRRTTPAVAARSATASAPPAESEPAAGVLAGTATETIAEGGDEARRRRRRRGGRGRGRSRRDEEAAPPAEAGETLGWEEFDDLSQLDGGAPDTAADARDYTFEDADADTLAELGLSADDLAAMAAAAPEASLAEAEASDADKDGAPKPRRRSTRAKAEAETPTSTDEAPKPRRRAPRAAPAREGEPAPSPARRRSTRSTSTQATPAATEDAPKPRRRSTRTTTEPQGDPPAADGDDQPPQGIWGRFRSGRAPRGT